MSTFLEISQSVKRDADDLLNESGLLSFLRDRGEVIFTGAYEADVMLAPDIDIHVEVPKKL